MTIWMGLALLQAVALPGRLLVRALGLDRDGFVQTAVFSFGLSLLINHFLVVGLVLVGAFTRPALLGILALEAVAAILLFARAPRRAAPRLGVLAHWRRARAEGPTGLPAAVAVALASFALLLLFVPRSFGSVFVLWDAIVSWNRWAADWASGLLPAWTMHYPQLIPTNWALVYVFQGSDVQFVPHGLMALFPLATLALLIDLGLRRREPAFLLAAPIYAGLLVGLLGRWIGSGHVDIPLAFFALLAVSPLWWDEAPEGSRRWVAMGLAVAGCALTKQGGLYLAAVLPALVAWTRPADARPGRLHAALTVAGLALVLVGPWYGWVEWQVAAGMEGNEATRTMDEIHGDKGPLERAVGGFDQWREALTPALFFPFLGLIGLSLTRPEARLTTLAIALPYAALWAGFLSYDLRNVALALPFLAIAAGSGLAVLTERLALRWPRPAPAAMAALAAVPLVAALAALPDSRGGEGAHDEQRLRLGHADLNARLQRYAAEPGFDGSILSNYRYLPNLPGFRDRVFIHRGGAASEFWPFRASTEAFARILDAPDHRIRYVVAVPPLRPDLRRYLARRVQQGEAEIVFQTPEGWLARIGPGT